VLHPINFYSESAFIPPSFMNARSIFRSPVRGTPSSAWSGFVPHTDRKRVDAFLQCSKRYGFCPPNLPQFDNYTSRCRLNSVSHHRQLSRPPSTFTATFVGFTALQSALSNSSVPFTGPHRTSNILSLFSSFLVQECILID